MFCWCKIHLDNRNFQLLQAIPSKKIKKAHCFTGFDLVVYCSNGRFRIFLGTLTSFPYVPYVFRPKKSCFTETSCANGLGYHHSNCDWDSVDTQCQRRAGVSKTVFFFAVVRDLYI